MWMFRSRDDTLSPEEVRATRTMAKMSVDQLASLVGRSPSQVEAWEAGTSRPPARAAAMLRYVHAVEERSALLERSGLPSCRDLERLRERVASAGDDSRRALASSLDLLAHMKACPVCRAREEYIERHGPPLPPMPMPTWLRMMNAPVDGGRRLIDRLPAPIRPPEGRAGEGRRGGLAIAAFLTLVVLARFSLFVIIGLVRGAPMADTVAAMLRMLPLVVVTYVAGFYLAGAAFDLTHTIEDRFAGHVARGALAFAALAGVFGVAMPFFDPTMTVTARGLGMILAIALAVGALVGAVLWAKDRVSGTLPGQTEGRES